jgi:hypothetical protein
LKLFIFVSQIEDYAGHGPFGVETRGLHSLGGAPHEFGKASGKAIAKHKAHFS